MKKQILIGLSVLALSQSLTAATESEFTKANLGTAETPTLTNKLVDRFSLQQLQSIIKDEGYGSVTIRDDKFITFKANGRSFILNLYKDGDLQLYYGATGVKVSAEDINEWNRTKRLSRAYLDTDRDVALESDLFANAGLSRKAVTELIKVFVNVSAPQFVDFIRDHDQNRS